MAISIRFNLNLNLVGSKICQPVALLAININKKKLLEFLSLIINNKYIKINNKHI